MHDELAGETSGNFQRLLLSMYSFPEKIEAQNLHIALKGLGTDEKVFLVDKKVFFFVLLVRIVLNILKITFFNKPD